MAVTFSQGLERTLQRAVSVAQEQGREYATPEDLLIALIDDEDASNVMRASLIDAEVLRRDVLAYMEGAVDEAVDNSSTVAKYAADLRRILQLVMIQVDSSRRQVATSADLLVELFTEPVVTGADLLVELFTEPVGHFLQKQGATRYDAVTYLSHGIARSAELTRPTATSEEDITARGDLSHLEVVLLNDSYTPMEFVVRGLQEVFGMDRDDAINVTLSTHKNGFGFCGVFSRAEATELAERLEKLAREHQHPLRCVMRPPPNPSAPPTAAEPNN